jgi:Bacterial transcriptional activator domain
MMCRRRFSTRATCSRGWPWTRRRSKNGYWQNVNASASSRWKAWRSSSSASAVPACWRGQSRTALRIAALDPLQESVHRTLMRLYVQSGRRGAALRQYQICVGVLLRELGIEPESETKQLYRDILQRREVTRGEGDVSETPADGGGHRDGATAIRTRGASQAPEHEGTLIGRELELTILQSALAEASRGAARC